MTDDEQKIQYIKDRAREMQEDKVNSAVGRQRVVAEKIAEGFAKGHAQARAEMIDALRQAGQGTLNSQLTLQQAQILVADAVGKTLFQLAANFEAIATPPKNDPPTD